MGATSVRFLNTWPVHGLTTGGSAVFPTSPSCRGRAGVFRHACPPSPSSSGNGKICPISKMSQDETHVRDRDFASSRSGAIVYSIANVSKRTREPRRFSPSALVVRSFTHIAGGGLVPPFIRLGGRFAKIGSASPDRILLRFLNDSRLRTIRRENGNGRRRNVGVAGTARGPLR